MCIVRVTNKNCFQNAIILILLSEQMVMTVLAHHRTNTVPNTFQIFFPLFSFAAVFSLHSFFLFAFFAFFCSFFFP